MWSIAGAVFAAAIAALAWWRGRTAGTSFYAGQVYGMTASTHRGYAGVSLAFVVLFAATLVFPQIPAVPLLAAYAVVAIFYLSSFVRGASGEDE